MNETHIESVQLEKVQEFRPSGELFGLPIKAIEVIGCGADPCSVCGPEGGQISLALVGCDGSWNVLDLSRPDAMKLSSILLEVLARSSRHRRTG